MIAAVIFIVLVILLLFTYVGYHIKLAFAILHPPVKKNIKSPADYNMNYTDFVAVSSDKLHIHGYFIPNQTANKGTIIISHNVGANQSKMLLYAKFLYEAGYHVVTYDWHSHGDSESDPSIFSTLKKNGNDLIAVIEKMKEEKWFQNSNQNIGLYGFSLGTLNVMRVFADMPEIKAIIMDCGPFIDVSDIFLKSLDRTKSLGKMFCKPLFKRIVLLTLCENCKKTIQSGIRKMNNRPVFIIHGDKDFIIPCTQSQKIYEQIESDKKEYWLVPRSYHLTAHSLYKEEYEERVLAFFQKYMY